MNVMYPASCKQTLPSEFFLFTPLRMIRLTYIFARISNSELTGKCGDDGGGVKSLVVGVTSGALSLPCRFLPLTVIHTHSSFLERYLRSRIPRAIWVRHLVWISWTRFVCFCYGAFVLWMFTSSPLSFANSGCPSYALHALSLFFGGRRRRSCIIDYGSFVNRARE